jgi:hypothetical protein
MIDSGVKSTVLHAAAPGRLVDFGFYKATMDLDDWRTSDRQPKTTRARWLNSFAMPSLAQAKDRVAGLVIRIGCTRQKEEDEREEEHHEDNLEESAPRVFGQGPDESDNEEYHRHEQD